MKSLGWPGQPHPGWPRRGDGDADGWMKAGAGPSPQGQARHRQPFVATPWRQSAQLGRHACGRPGHLLGGGLGRGHRSEREGLGQDGLAQRLGALQVGFDLGFDAAGDGEAAVDFGDDAFALR